jgi:hypothetical protein
MSTFNLNEKVVGSAVFNNGIAGKAVGVSVVIEKKRVDEPDINPGYKLIVSDESGGVSINQGFCFNDWEKETDEKRQNQTYQRVKSIAEALVPEDFVYPAVNGYVDAINTLFKVIKENSEGKKVDVFVTYGYTAKPSKYLGLRMFNFIQKQDVKFDRLKPTNTDILERPEADAPKADNPGTETKASADIW